MELKYSEMHDDAKLDCIAAQGITAISAPYEFVESTPKEILKERSRALSARGMKVQTAHPRFGLYNSDNSLANQYIAQRNFYIEQLKDGMDRMSILGVKAAPLHTNGACLTVAPEWALELCMESINAIIPAATDAGIILAIENTFFTVPQRWDGGYGADARPGQTSELVYDDIYKVCRLIDLLASPNVKGCYDVGHAHYLGNLTEDHNAMGERICLYHIHDNSRDIDSHLPPGYGTLDWDALGELIAENKKPYIIYIEANPWMRGSYALMIRETKALLSGGRGSVGRRCLKCGHSILSDDKGEFCGC